MSPNVERLTLIELLIALLGNVVYFGVHGHCDRLEVGWDLEVQDKFTICTELNILISLSDWDGINIGLGGQGDLGVLKDVGGSLAVVYGKVGFYQDLGFGTD